MKVCDNCSRINPDDIEKCLECGQTEFTPILDPPFYDAEEEWEKWRKEESKK